MRRFHSAVSLLLWGSKETAQFLLASHSTPPQVELIAQEGFLNAKDSLANYSYIVNLYRHIFSQNCNS
jgi:hypothetical protein